MPQAVPFQEDAHLLHIGLHGGLNMVSVTNLLANLIQQPFGAQHRRAAGFMAQFGTAYLHRLHIAKLGCKPLLAFFVPI
jgi:hypothetical protein